MTNALTPEAYLEKAMGFLSDAVASSTVTMDSVAPVLTARHLYELATKEEHDCVVWDGEYSEEQRIRSNDAVYARQDAERRIKRAHHALALELSGMSRENALTQLELEDMARVDASGFWRSSDGNESNDVHDPFLNRAIVFLADATVKAGVSADAVITALLARDRYDRAIDIMEGDWNRSTPDIEERIRFDEATEELDEATGRYLHAERALALELSGTDRQAALTQVALEDMAGLL